MKFFKELKRRNVIKETLAYLVVSWVLIQVASTILPIVDAPDWVLKTGIFLLVLGLPVWIFFSWAYQVTPEGFKKTAKVSEASSGDPVSYIRFNYIIIIGLIMAIAVSFYNRSVPILKSPDTPNIEIKKTIAVLPFEDLSSGGDTEWFCDGVTEDIRTNLSKIKEIEKVISYTSVMQYKESRPTIPEIAQKLGVSYILEGSVRKHNDQIIITAQLIDASDRQIWSEHYDNTFDKVFEIQKNVAKQITQQLKLNLSAEEENQIEFMPTENLESYDMYIRGRYYWNKRTEKDLLLSVEYFKKAIEFDPLFAQAWSGLSASYAMLSAYNHLTSIEGNRMAKNAADKAIEINPELAGPHATLGWVAMHDHDWEKSSHEFELALKYDPNNSTAHSWYAWMLAAKGIFDKAEMHIQLARGLDPLSDVILASSGWIALTSGSNDRAMELFKSAIEINPEFPRFQLWLGYAYMGVEDYDAAISHLLRAVTLSERHPQYLSNLGFCYGAAKQPAKAQNIVNEILSKSEESFVSNYDIGLALLGTDQVALALDYFDKAYESKDIWVLFLAVDQRFDYLHDNPKFRDIIEKTGIKPQWME